MKKNKLHELFGVDPEPEDLKESVREPKTKNASHDFEEHEKPLRISDVVFGFNPQTAASRFREASMPFSNPDSGTEFDDKFFQPLEVAGGIDLPIHTQNAVQRLSNLLYRKNVRAYRMVELVDQFAFGSEPRFLANDPKVQKVLEQHWEANDWEGNLSKRMKALSVFGEQLYPVFINQTSGLVTISSISPLKIRRVERNPEDAERLISIVATLGGEGAVNLEFDPNKLAPEDRRYGIILRRRDGTIGVEDELPGETSGDAFFFAVNMLSGATRGQPDVTPSIDWLEGLDGFVWGLLERANMAQQVVQDLTFEGVSDDREIQRLTTQFIRALKGGGVYGHNEKVTLKMQSPEIGASEADKVTSVILKQIQSGTGLAGLFYGDSEDLTRAAASELTTPVAKMIQDRQNFFKRSLRLMFKFQIQTSIEKGVLSKDVDQGFVIDMPRVFLRDMTTITTALVSLTAALTNAVDNEWIDNEEAGKVYKAAQEELGDFIDHQQPTSSGAAESDVPGVSEAYVRANNLQNGHTNRQTTTS